MIISQNVSLLTYMVQTNTIENKMIKYCIIVSFILSVVVGSDGGWHCGRHLWTNNLQYIFFSTKSTARKKGHRHHHHHQIRWKFIEHEHLVDNMNAHGKLCHTYKRQHCCSTRGKTRMQVIFVRGGWVRVRKIFVRGERK